LWEAELIDRPLLLGAPPGLSVHYSEAGQPQVLALAGEPVPEVRYCGGSDLGLYTPASSEPPEGELPRWERSWVVEDSDQAASGEPASDYGYVVGYWPSYARSREGAELVSYQDVHSGSIQRDDLARADLEVALRESPSGAWRHEVVDLGEGAGSGSQALFSRDGTPLVLYVVALEAAQQERDRQGVWLARKVDGVWRRSLVMAGPTQGVPQAVPYASGLAVLYFDPRARQPVLATLNDLNALSPLEALADSTLNESPSGGVEAGAETGAEAEGVSLNDPWARARLGDPRYNEGHSPALALDPNGRLLAAWYRCGSAERESCSPSDDAAVFAWTPQTSSEALGFGDGPILSAPELIWRLEVIERGEEAPCGLDPSLTVEGSGRVWATWRCSRRLNATTFGYRLESARRDPFEG
jgi:hypothetical protein